MKPIVSIIMGSTSDLPVMEKACKLLDEMQVPFEVNALSAHRTPDAVEEFQLCRGSPAVTRQSYSQVTGPQDESTCNSEALWLRYHLKF